MMKLKLVLMLIIVCVATTLNAQLKNVADSTGYAYGYQQYLDMQHQLQPDEFSLQAFGQGFLDAVNNSPKIAQDQMMPIIQAFSQKMQTKMAEQQAQQQAESAQVAAANKEEGAKFMAKNKNKKGVVTTQSGLQYEVIIEGTGKQPAATDMVTVHYTGTLLDGTKFDSSVDRGQPANFPLNQVIAGWTEGLQLMKEGGKAKLYIPSALGYGDNAPQGSTIKPGSTLIFEVELIKVGQ